jgi:DNA-binding CsgD family transcriptional regulator
MRQSGPVHWMHRKPELIRRGPQANGAKLTEHDIAAICALADFPTDEIARHFNVSRFTVWRHLKAAGLR